MKKLNLVFLCAVIFLTPTEGLAQDTLVWNQKTIIPVHRTSNDLGVTTAFGHLWISFAGATADQTVNLLASANGVNFNDGPGPIIGKRSEYGVRVAFNPNCQALYLAYIGRDSNKSVNVTQSLDGGATWNSQILVGTTNGLTTDSPAITLLDNGNMGVAWGTSRCEQADDPDRCINATSLREVSCGMQVQNASCFFDDPIEGTCNTTFGFPSFLGSPAWEGAGDLRAVSKQNTRPMQFKFGPFGGTFTFGLNWAMEGPSLTKNPGGSYYVAWRGGDNRINVGNLSTGVHRVAFDTSTRAPAITVFNGQLYVVWRGAGDGINVASANLF